MRPSKRPLAWLAGSLIYACGSGDDALGVERERLSAAEESAGEQVTVAGDGDASEDLTGGDLTVDDLECIAGGGKVSQVKVAFDCHEITTVSCKDLSNVVLEFADGSRQRFEGLSSQRGVFFGTGRHEGATITSVWIKAGANFSGDGPGYGQRFDAPADSCSPPPTDECIVADGSCNPGNPPPPPPPEDDCFVADGSCNPGDPPPPPPPEEDCFVADGSCNPGFTPPPPPPPAEEPDMLI